MQRIKALPVLVVVVLAAASCGGSDEAQVDDDVAAASSTADDSATTEATVAETTTTEEPTTTEESTTTTTEATTITTEPPPELPEPPPAGTGVLTVDGEEFAFTIEKCVTEPAIAPTGTGLIMFEVRGSTIVEGQPAEARLFRLADANGLDGNDSFGWGYATDRNDFETLRSEGSPFGIGEYLIVQETEAGTTFYGAPTTFERTEGISVVDENVGEGTIIATC